MFQYGPEDFGTLDRSAMIIKPTQEFKAMLEKDFPGIFNLIQKAPKPDPVYLIPEEEAEGQSETWLDVHYFHIFIDMLRLYELDSESFSGRRSLQQFKAWFQASFFPIVIETQHDEDFVPPVNYGSY